MGNTEALLEQVRRLERSGSAPGLEEGEQERAPSVPPSRQAALGERVQSEEQGEVPISSRRSGGGRWSDDRSDTASTGEKRLYTALRGAGMEKAVALEPPERVLTPWEEKERAGEGSALLEQLERLERAAGAGAGDGAVGRPTAWEEDRAAGRSAVSGNLDRIRRSTVSSGAAGAVGDGWSLEADLVRPDVQPTEDLRWAEQADRVFRRDSRRYDGGFYLY